MSDGEKKKVFDILLLLDWKKGGVVLLVWIASFILHNVTYGLFFRHFSKTGGDETVFFLFAILIIPLYLIVALIYTFIKTFKKK
jgi:hypothetical protein